MANSCIYIYRNYDDDGLVPEYLDVREYCGTLLCRWCTYVCDATAFNNLSEAKKNILKNILKNLVIQNIVLLSWSLLQ